ncbi:hypothetical protein HDN1F_34970 [gamma proteobacterium HdN1]|nr:Hypothetical protein HDN1F_18220 [gamma proteobacterium HdN1]CBL47080.1 hypothetical protein HDN1F_34970 [gamma proteobacterium HdN1]
MMRTVAPNRHGGCFVQILRPLGGLLGGAIFITSVTAAHADDISVGYALISPTATADQTDLLSVVIQHDFPAQITTVGDAIHQLLERSGYRLAFGAVADPDLPILLDLPLPMVHRKLHQIRLRTALQTLAGEAWVLVEDPVNRLISFDLRERRPAQQQAAEAKGV